MSKESVNVNGLIILSAVLSLMMSVACYSVLLLIDVDFTTTLICSFLTFLSIHPLTSTKERYFIEHYGKTCFFK